MLALLAAAAVVAGCAKKGPPSGGPPDLEPPRIVAVSPDSGAARVPRDVHVTISFSEGMEPRGTGSAVEFSPPLEIKQRRWSGHTLTLVLKDTLKADHTYTLFVGGNARDLHGNNLADSRTVVFTTADSFPRGIIDGRVETVGFRPQGVLLWCYRDGRAPDSTARDFDALGVADQAGNFRVAGLATNAKWHLWAFADLNHNRSFEPDADLLVPGDSVVTLTDAEPEAKGIAFQLVDQKAPGHFIGVVTDTVGEGKGSIRILQISVADTTKRMLYEIPESGSFDLRWDPGLYRVRAFRDQDRNRAWKRDTEPASAEIEVRITPGGEVKGVMLLLLRPQAAAPAPPDTTAAPPRPPEEPKQ